VNICHTLVYYDSPISQTWVT